MTALAESPCPGSLFLTFFSVYVPSVVNEVSAFAFAFVVAVEDASSLVRADREALSYSFQGEESIGARRKRSAYKVSVITIPVVNPVSAFCLEAISFHSLSRTVSHTSNLKREKCETENTSPTERKKQATKKTPTQKQGLGLLLSLLLYSLNDDFFLYSGLGL